MAVSLIRRLIASNMVDVEVNEVLSYKRALNYRRRLWDLSSTQFDAVESKREGHKYSTLAI